MNVKKLIELLKNIDQELEVVYEYDAWFVLVKDIEIVSIIPSKFGYDGNFDPVPDETPNAIKAVNLSA